MGKLHEIHVSVDPTHKKESCDDLGASTHTRIEGAILASLWYGAIQDREDAIKPAYKRTFEWIFSPQSPMTPRPWSDFSEFLSSDQEHLYWVSGKAGCGKGTLMKFIMDGRTRENLATWAQSRGKSLLVAAFYFYYIGARLQKTRTGLLRSLLHHLLSQERALIPTAFPVRFRAMQHHRDICDFEPSNEELLRAFKTLMSESTDHVFFIAIDGLDEYDDADKLPELCEELKMLGTQPRVKLLLSSRPLHECELAFTTHASLQLHHLTRSDIRLYVSGRIRQHRNNSTLSAEDTGRLVESLVESSSGVFVSVRWVINSVLEGLSNWDSISEIEQRLEEIPKDIVDLYAHILDRIPERYRKSASEIFLLMKSGPDNDRISPLGLSLACEGSETALS
jgi:hypothetical protein